MRTVCYLMRQTKVLSSWETAQSSKPHVLYTVLTGQNPTGSTQSLNRRKAIYEIAERHDLVIVEDDPYYFLQMPPYHHSDGSSGTSGSNGQTTEDQTSIEAFHSQYIPSFLSLDTSGRVVHLDSTAKILAPGLRAGWVTASSQIIDKFLAYPEIRTVSVSGPSQLMLWHLLDESWAYSGFLSWLMYFSQEYQWRRNVVLDSYNLYLPKENFTVGFTGFWHVSMDRNGLEAGSSTCMSQWITGGNRCTNT